MEMDALWTSIPTNDLMVFFMPSLLTTGEPMDAALEKTYRLRSPKL
jgi:hypothetical protein